VQVPLITSKVVNDGRKKIANGGLEEGSLYLRPEFGRGGASGCSC